MLKLHPIAQQEQLEHTATAELPVILCAAAVLRLVALAQFTAILVGLAMESAATNPVGEDEDEGATGTDKAGDRDDDSEVE